MERFIIFSRYHEHKDDLFISYNQNGRWTEAESLPVVGTNCHETAWISRDGKTLYFTRTGDFYQIELSVLGINN